MSKDADLTCSMGANDKQSSSASASYQNNKHNESLKSSWILYKAGEMENRPGQMDKDY